MKERSHSFKALGYLVAHMVLAAIGILAIYGVLHFTVPDAFAQYAVLLTVFTFFLVGFYLLCALPCGVMTLWHCVCAMVKDRKFVFPIIYILLDMGLLAFLVYALCKLF